MVIKLAKVNEIVNNHKSSKLTKFWIIRIFELEAREPMNELIKIGNPIIKAFFK